MTQRTIQMFFTLVLVACGTTSAQAQWNPVRQLENAGRRLENSVRTEAGRGAEAVKRAHAMNYNVVIHNPTGNSIFYRFEGQPHALPPHSSKKHWGSKVGRPQVKFDNGRNQDIGYGLDGNREFAFNWNNGVLDLFRK